MERSPERAGCDVKVKAKKLHPDAKLPTYATDGSGAFDLYAAEPCYVYPGECCPVPTGLSVESPAGYGMFVLSRSGHARRHSVRLANSVGLIDSDYRGEVQVLLYCEYSAPDGLQVQRGDRIAQALVLPTPRIEFEEVDELTPTARGTGGFGSTGA